MKKNAFFVFCAVAFLMVSCSAEETTEPKDGSGEKEEVTESLVSYSLDTENSTLAWKGFEGDHEFHVGTVDFTEGSMVMNGNSVEEGTFVVDMTTITVTDEGMPDQYKTKLEGHLGADDVWNIAQFATTSVTLGEYKDGNLSIMLSVLGKKVPAIVPVSITADDSGAKIKGKFTVDFASLEVPLFQPQEEEDESISPVIEFELTAVLTKK